MTILDSNVASAPKKRGRKPGSKNKKQKINTPKKANYLTSFTLLDHGIMQLSNTLKKATKQAEIEIEKLKKRHAVELESLKVKSLSSIALWKERANNTRKKAKVKIKTAKQKKVKAAKPAGRVGRPPKTRYRKGGGRRKTGELTKRDVIYNYVVEYNAPISTKDLIQNLFELSGERDKKRFSQGIYTNLTQIYKDGEFINTGGIVTIGKKR